MATVYQQEDLSSRLKRLILSNSFHLQNRVWKVTVQNNMIKTIDQGWDKTDADSPLSTEDMSSSRFYKKNRPFFEDIFLPLMQRYDRFKTTWILDESGDISAHEHSYINGRFQFHGDNFLSEIHSIQKKFPEIFRQRDSQIFFRGYKGNINALDFKYYYYSDYYTNLNSNPLDDECRKANFLFFHRMAAIAKNRDMVEFFSEKNENGEITDLYVKNFSYNSNDY